MKSLALRVFFKSFATLGIVFGLALSAHAGTDLQTSIESNDSVTLPGFPTIGKWMVDDNGEIAHWLGYIYDGKKMAEPINVIIRVNRQTSAEAEQALMQATGDAGFKIRRGHSSGYTTILGSERVAQFPDTKGYAFSDMPYLLPNDHGRIFGPVAYEGTYYFVAALSREGTDVIGKVLNSKNLLHVYDSFQEARSRFVNRLCDTGQAVNSGTINMENALPVSDPDRTTGDHDGNAIVLDLN
jgi:hypothetical protein